jgi:hypothetical protein
LKKDEIIGSVSTIISNQELVISEFRAFVDELLMPVMNLIYAEEALIIEKYK